MASATRLLTARKIWHLLTSAQRRSAMLLLALMFIGMILETLGIGLVVPAVTLLSQGESAGASVALQPLVRALGNPSQQTLLVAGMIVLVGIYLVKVLFLAYLAWRQTRFAFDVQVSLSQRLFTVYLRQPYTFHLQRNSAELIRNVITEVGLFTGAGLMPAMLLLTESLVLLGLCTLLIVVEPVGSLLVVSVLGVFAWGFHRLTSGRIARWGETRQLHEGLRLQHLQEGLGGAKDVKLLGRESDFLEQFRLHNVHCAHVARLKTTLEQLPRLWLELLAVGGLAILVISMVAQDQALSAVLPTLGLFAAAAFRLIPSVNRILGALQSLRYGLPGIDVLHAELALPLADEPVGRGPTVQFRHELELSDVEYAYPGVRDAALKGVSLSVRRGESVGFVGSSGAGKSTLVDILLGLLTPDSGAVRVDGKNVQTSLRNWQDQIGYVPQSIFLTDDSLRRNVAFGLARDQIDEAAVDRAIRAAQLEEFVATLPEGLDTVVGERGVRLSGGQRQRIGIARALYHDPTVLVLDEATSSLDTGTEREVMRAVAALHGRKTILIVAHRLSTVENCDRIYRVDKGRVVADGEPADVLHMARSSSGRGPES